MTLTIRSHSITEERLREIAGPTSVHGSFLPVDRLVAVAEVQRGDYSHLVVEGMRGGDGVSRYFARVDRGERVPLDVGGGRITTVYYGDEDGDGHNDIIVRLEEGGLLVFSAEETQEGATTRPPEAALEAGNAPGAASGSPARNDGRVTVERP